MKPLKRWDGKPDMSWKEIAQLEHWANCSGKKYEGSTCIYFHPKMQRKVDAIKITRLPVRACIHWKYPRIK